MDFSRHESMSENFGFELPDESKELTDKEYVNLVNRIRGNFLSYVSVLDSTLTLIITDFFLRDKDDFPLWAKTVFDEDRTASFGTRLCGYLESSKIIHNIKKRLMKKLEYNFNKN